VYMSLNTQVLDSSALLRILTRTLSLNFLTLFSLRSWLKRELGGRFAGLAQTLTSRVIERRLHSQAGSQYGYGLLFVVLLAGLFAVLLQVCSFVDKSRDCF
jgi:hypothetical protein